MKTNQERMEEIKALITILVEQKLAGNDEKAANMEKHIDPIWDVLTDSQQGEIATFEWNLEQENGLNQPQNAALDALRLARQHNLNFEIDQRIDSLENDSPLVWP
tara:strand:- start:2677 stop:2991 length:315 start_codon:yes stop_codon:yes gene_type:complete